MYNTIQNFFFGSLNDNLGPLTVPMIDLPMAPPSSGRLPWTTRAEELPGMPGGGHCGHCSCDSKGWESLWIDMDW